MRSLLRRLAFLTSFMSVVAAGPAAAQAASGAPAMDSAPAEQPRGKGVGKARARAAKPSGDGTVAASPAAARRPAAPALSQAQQRPMRFDPADIADPLSPPRQSDGRFEPTLTPGRAGMRGRF